METGCQGHTLGTRDPPCGAPLRNTGTFSHSPACPVSGHSPFLLARRPRARDRRRHFSLFPGCARTAHNPNKPGASASQRIPPLDAEAPRACALRLSAPPLRRAASPLPPPGRAQAQSLAVDALANGVRARSAEREGVGPSARSRPALRGNAIGRRFPRKSWFPPRHRPLRLPGLSQELYEDGCGRAFHFIELLGPG